MSAEYDFSSLGEVPQLSLASTETRAFLGRRAMLAEDSIQTELARDPESWDRFAACADRMELFTEPDGKELAQNRRLRERATKNICNTACPVKAQCLARAFSLDDKHSVMGGMTADERAQLGRRKRGRRIA